MAGRHQRAKPASRRRPALLTLCALTVLTVSVVAGVYLFRSGPAVRGEASIVPPQCTAPMVTLVVDAAPAMAIPVTRIAQDWIRQSPLADGKCIQVEVDSDTVDQQELRLSGQSGANTAVWLPDSTIWLQRLQADLATQAGNTLSITSRSSLASSPLVVVSSPDRAAAQATQAGNPNFDPIATAAIAGPVQNSEGLLTLLTAESQFASLQSANAALVAKFLQLNRSTLNLITDGFDQLSSDPAHAPPFVASEQQVIATNSLAGSKVAAAIYPVKPTLGLDYPVALLHRPNDDPALATAADLFDKQLRLASSLNRFHQAGLRSPDGSPVPKTGAAQGVLPDLVPSLPEPTASQTLGLLRLWKAAIADSNTLAVLDLSGSMADPAGNGQSKIAVAAAAARLAVSFFPNSSALGLWAFSSDQARSAPWAQLVPLGLLGDRLGPVSRRQALLIAAAGLPARVHGGTALYDTALAAYRQVQHSYDPRKSNSVVLMTDGQNDYPGGKTLAGLLAALHASADASRPIRIITIGIGPGADADALGKISAATGGRYYQVRNAGDISGVFLDAVSQRR
ncbi:MAG TPA: VWA domain-containing protein [Jatrophihabitans sp.]|nr:VWA domain-containing protein [Jatrophihabitans sp.]